MANIIIPEFKNTDEFKLMKSKAWEYINGIGNFDIDDFEPAQYKYFDKLLQLYGKLKAEKITREQAVYEDEKNICELENYVKRLEYIPVRQLKAFNIKSTYEEMTKIERSNDINEMFGFMADAISKMTGDESFASRQKKKITGVQNDRK